MTDEDKFKYLHEKLDNIHTDLKDHIQDEEGELKTIHTRLGSVEDDNKELKTIYRMIKMSVIFIGGALAIFWTDVKSFFGR